MKGELLKAITTLVFAIGENQRGSDALSVIANELDRLKERERMLIHTLNELYEASNELLMSGVFFYNQDSLYGLYMKFVDVLEQADKVLEGN